MIKLALRSALSDRAADGKVLVIDDWGFDAPSTKRAAAALQALGIDGRVVIVVAPDDIATGRSFRNLPHVHLLEPGELNAYDVLVAEYVVFTRATLPTSAATGGEGDAPTRAAAPKAKRPTTVAPAADSPEADAGPDAAAISDPQGDTDMASDLPSRPKSTGEVTKPVDPAERVKPAGEKTDPRFEAARLKAEKEAEVRAAKEQAAATPDDTEADDAEAEPEAPRPAGGFSFNQTADADEEPS
jgi:large subunit ribosomal protein L4